MTEWEAARDALSRRDFLVRAGQLGALTALGPGTLHGLERYSTIAGWRQAPAVNPGLHWRMLGPFRGGRVAAESPFVRHQVLLHDRERRAAQASSGRR